MGNQNIFHVLLISIQVLMNITVTKCNVSQTSIIVYVYWSNASNLYRESTCIDQV